MKFEGEDSGDTHCTQRATGCVTPAAFASDVDAAAHPRLMSSIVEHLPDMIFVKEAKELRYVQFNRAGETMLGRPREELLGKNDFDLFPEDEAASYIEIDREVLREGKMFEISEEPLHTAAGLRTLRTKKVPIFDEHGCATHLLGISEDITELRAVQHDLHATRDALVAAQFREAQKAQLLAIARAPLPLELNELLMELKSAAQLLREQVSHTPAQSELAKRFLDIAERSAKFLLATPVDAVQRLADD